MLVYVTQKTTTRYEYESERLDAARAFLTEEGILGESAAADKRFVNLQIETSGNAQELGAEN